MNVNTRGLGRKRAAQYVRRSFAGSLVFVALLWANSAKAALTLCNVTSSRIGVAIGYQDGDNTVSEGWWNIAPKTCEALLAGDVPSRFIYVHAVDYDRGGEWAGKTFMCAQDKSFAVRGTQECQKRGFQRIGFFVVDVGDAKDWTIRLTDPEEKKDKT